MPTHIELLKVRVKLDGAPIRYKERRYLPENEAVVTRYAKELVNLGFVKKATSPQWVSSPLIVPKRRPAMYCITIDYGEVITLGKRRSGLCLALKRSFLSKLTIFID